MQTEERKVRVIPATEKAVRSAGSRGLVGKRRVAAYARVSTDSDEQATSYEAQVDFYTKKIQGNPEWEFAGMYADEGVSGTSTKGRDGFKKMVRDALAGKIDLILTKSVSRFARNTVDAISTIRALKARNVEVYFEKENIYTLDSKGELLITIMGSLAQEESRSLSQNVTWGKRKRFADGRFSMPYAHFLGYRKGPDGMPEVVPEEAETVREIYARFLAGETPGGIAKALTAKGVKSPGGKDGWTTTNVRSIIANEKYKGDALLQKTFTVDFLGHKRKQNEGEVQQYYVTGCHEAIVDPDEWELAQAEMARRDALGLSYRGGTPFSGRIVCADCGSFFGPKLWHSTDPYARTVWQCNHKFSNGKRCKTPHLYEDDVKSAFVEAYNSLASIREAVTEDLDLIASAVEDPESFQAEIDREAESGALIAAAARDLIARNASKGMARDEFEREYRKLDEKYKASKRKMEDLQSKQRDAAARKAKARAFAKAYAKGGPTIAEWDAGLWCLMVEEVRVNRDGSMEFRFRNGSSVTIAARK